MVGYKKVQASTWWDADLVFALLILPWFFSFLQHSIIYKKLYNRKNFFDSFIIISFVHAQFFVWNVHKCFKNKKTFLS